MKRYKWYKCSVCESCCPCYAATFEENLQPVSSCILAGDGYDPGPAQWVEVGASEVPR